MSEPLAIGVDMGGTKTVFGVVTATGEVLEEFFVPSPKQTADGAFEVLLAGIDQLRAKYSVKALGVGVAGFVDRTGTRVEFAPHLPWRGEPLAARLSAAVDLPVVLDNDANQATWAEWKLGAGRTSQDLLVVSFGTGIGGGLVLGGQLHRGWSGMAGEMGHQQVVQNGIDCPCGNNGCWEQYASGRALDRAARDQVSAATPLGGELLEAAGDEPVAGPAVSALARTGNAAARELTNEIGHWIAVGLSNLTAVLDPEMFVVAGGLVDDQELFLEPARETFAQLVPGRGHRELPAIVAAELGSGAALIGAAARALSESQ